MTKPKRKTNARRVERLSPRAVRRIELTAEIARISGELRGQLEPLSIGERLLPALNVRL
jgi:hypothetical protein